MTTLTQTQKVYFFGNKTADANAGMRELIGGKGANLAEMTRLGVPVPPGFTIATDECDAYYQNNEQLSVPLIDEMKQNLAKVEQVMGKTFGNSDNPLLFSVRSGARISMPGMMDTILNLGLNDQAVEGLAKVSGNPRFAWDSYRRLIQMFGNVVLEVEHAEFEKALEKKKHERGVELDTELNVQDLQELVQTFKHILKENNQVFPQDPQEQLIQSVGAVFRSWNASRAIKYRQINKIPHDWGTGVNVQAMVFGNLGESSGTGVAFTRNPSTGENVFYGEYLINAQGEDVVAGIRTPEPIDTLELAMPDIYAELEAIYLNLEKHYRDMQDMEFTIENKTLFILQTRTGKRTAAAAVKIAVDMVHENLITKEEAVLRVDPNQVDQLLHPMVDPKATVDVLAKGLPASPGAAVGKIVLTADDAEAAKARGEVVILVREETSPEDIGGMDAAEGILTARGGMTSHAAVVARGMGKCCVAGCSQLTFDEANRTISVGGKTFAENQFISLNGTTGEILSGEVPLIKPELSDDFDVLMEWADSFRTLKVRTNADTPHDAQVARGFGAEGIGLCRTEHMFFEGDRIQVVREMILASNLEGRQKALAKLEPIQQSDFEGIFEEMEGLPVTVRLLDPPLHEFLPTDAETIQTIATELGVSIDALNKKINSLHEFNPMLGHRGCRLAVTYPEIYDMQVRAIVQAAIAVHKRGKDVRPEIMIPLVSEFNELKLLKDRARHIVDEAIDAANISLHVLIGTMIETPRAALCADDIASEAEFFSFGTNDLTQMAFGVSRDDSGMFLPEYVEKGVLKEDPFQVLDQRGVGQLMQMAVEKGKGVRSDIKLGVCGEHGGEPESVIFCHGLGLEYVSCSPYRVPIARLAAAHAVLKGK